MTLPLFVLRPEPGLRVTLETAQSLGLEAHGCPLFDVRPSRWEPPAKADFDALLIGSSNALRHGGSGLSRLEGLPVYAVGEATADAARDKGFMVARKGKGGLQAMLDELGGRSIRFLRLAGEKRIPLEPPAGIEITTVAVYKTKPLDISADIARVMRRKGGVVLLHSGEAALRFTEECARLEVDRSRLVVAALGARIADLAGEGWKSVHTAPQPVDADLLALAKALCQG